MTASPRPKAPNDSPAGPRRGVPVQHPRSKASGRPKAGGRPKKRRAPGWVPDHHGAWAMIAIPALAGVVIGGPSWRHLPLLGLWWVGYFFFNAASLWLKSRRRARFFPPVRVYGLTLIPLALAVAISAPWLMGWALWFAPLLATTAWCSARRKDRSLLNDVVTVAAACLMTMVTFDAASIPASFTSGVAFDPLAVTRPDVWAPSRTWGVDPITSTAWAWRVTAVFAVYFIGTIPHVKALIRERDNPAYVVGTAVYHALALIGAILAVATTWWTPGLPSACLVALAVICLARTIAMPLMQRRSGTMRPRVIGVTEVVVSLLLLPIVLIN
ncbi:MAG: YwiC-like family protein [Bowdeniella nasicola]|nr:YwiC-like family protein [Bowdeniella nasicola]